jgi:hypothetical protein
MQAQVTWQRHLDSVRWAVGEEHRGAGAAPVALVEVLACGKLTRRPLKRTEEGAPGLYPSRRGAPRASSYVRTTSRRRCPR